jgi:phosphate starvation-inducible PhoH-like protein
MVTTQRLTKKQKRVMRQHDQAEETTQRNSLNLKKIEPLTVNQKKTFKSYESGKNILLHGIAGTGKSFISLYLSLKDVLNKDCLYEKVYIVRSVVPTRDMGFLPGNTKEKAKVYEAPYYAICTELFNRKDSYDTLKNRGVVEFTTTSFIRGITFNNCIIVVDEIANMTLHELDSIITRIGNNCRVLLCGDFRQSDFTKDQERAGLKDFMRIIKRMKSFEFIDFEIEDIVRSQIVKEYIIVKDQYDRRSKEVYPRLLTESDTADNDND